MNKYSVELLPSDVSKRLATNLKVIRKQKKISQKELAERSGVSLGSIKRFETKGLISLESLLKLAQILGRLQDFENVLKPIKNKTEIENLFSTKAQK